MVRVLTPAILVLVGGVVAFDGLAEQPAAPPTATGAGAPPASSAPAGPQGGGVPATRLNDRSNPVLSPEGDVRASKAVGLVVYNDQDQKVGTIDDILLGEDNQPPRVVLSVGGFLGMGAKLVVVPFERLEFGEVRGASDKKVVMRGASKGVLKRLPAYHYSSSKG